MAPLKVTYDEVADAAYLYLQPPGTRVAKMYPCDPIDVDGVINIDLDADGRLVGVEVLAARTKLVPEILAIADEVSEEPGGLAGRARWQPVFPASMDDGDWSLTEAKGWIDLAVRSTGGEKMVSFYDPARLAQEIQDALTGPGYFAQSSIVVVPAVTREAITAAVARMG